MRQRQRPHRARHTDRAAADDTLHEGHRPTRLHEQIRCRCRGRGLPAVERLNGPAIVVHEKKAAADSRRLRLDQRQHHLYRDRGVHRGAAGPQDLIARVGGQWMRSGDHEMARVDALLGIEPALRFGGLSVDRRRRMAASEQRGDDQRAAGCAQTNTAHRRQCARHAVKPVLQAAYARRAAGTESARPVRSTHPASRD